MLKRNYFFMVLFPMAFSLSGPPKPAVVKAEDLVRRYTNSNDTTYVINFWATWCDPCVKELPDFEKLNENYKNKKVKVILVSIDFLADYDSRLIPFLKKKEMKSEIMLLNETKPNDFINKINPKWQGSIPSTMIINNEQKYSQFFESPLTYEFLETKMKALGL
jgi:thiol-disulfide isomerase/thioredoxin